MVEEEHELSGAFKNRPHLRSKRVQIASGEAAEIEQRVNAAKWDAYRERFNAWKGRDAEVLLSITRRLVRGGMVGGMRLEEMIAEELQKQARYRSKPRAVGARWMRYATRWSKTVFLGEFAR